MKVTLSIYVKQVQYGDMKHFFYHAQKILFVQMIWCLHLFLSPVFFYIPSVLF